MTVQINDAKLKTLLTAGYTGTSDEMFRQYYLSKIVGGGTTEYDYWNQFATVPDKGKSFNQVKKSGLYGLGYNYPTLQESEFQYWNGVVLPPISGASDPFWSSVGASWPLTADFNDLSANAYHFTPSGAVISSAQKRFAGDAGSAYFDGSSYASRANSPLVRLPTALANYTVELSFMATSVASTTVLMGQRNVGTTDGWRLTVEAGGGYSWQVSTNAATQGAGALTAGVWYDMCIRCSGTNMFTYINGSQQVNTSGTLVADLVSNLVLGSRLPAADLKFTGYIAHVRITNADRHPGATGVPVPTGPWPTS